MHWIAKPNLRKLCEGKKNDDKPEIDPTVDLNYGNPSL
jgi:hypothetical protein